MKTGKWYAEFLPINNSTPSLGITTANDSPILFNTTGSVEMYEYNNAGRAYHSPTAINGYGDTFASGDIIGVALDMDNTTLTFEQIARTLGLDSGCTCQGFPNPWVFSRSGSNHARRPSQQLSTANREDLHLR